MKGLKTGGRQRGTPNKSTAVVTNVLDGKNLNLIDEAMTLYSRGNDEFKLKVLTLLFPYRYPKRVEKLSEQPQDSEIDITDEYQAALDMVEFISQKFPQLIHSKAEVDKNK